MFPRLLRILGLPVLATAVLAVAVPPAPVTAAPAPSAATSAAVSATHRVAAAAKRPTAKRHTRTHRKTRHHTKRHTRTAKHRKTRPHTPRATTRASRGDSRSVASLNWAALARCESSGNPRATNPAGYYGLYQFDVATWRSVGGHGNPAQASAAEQTQRAQILYLRRGASPWPHCGRHLND